MRGQAKHDGPEMVRLPKCAKLNGESWGTAGPYPFAYLLRFSSLTMPRSWPLRVSDFRVRLVFWTWYARWVLMEQQEQNCREHVCSRLLIENRLSSPQCLGLERNLIIAEAQTCPPAPCKSFRVKEFWWHMVNLMTSTTASHIRICPDSRFFRGYASV